MRSIFIPRDKKDRDRWREDVGGNTFELMPFGFSRAWALCESGTAKRIGMLTWDKTSARSVIRWLEKSCWARCCHAGCPFETYGKARIGGLCLIHSLAALTRIQARYAVDPSDFGVDPEAAIDFYLRRSVSARPDTLAAEDFLLGTSCGRTLLAHRLADTVPAITPLQADTRLGKNIDAQNTSRRHKLGTPIIRV